ncbi:hypothetical protein NDR87_00605 [Nocardia sp. CDC159]|uniref:Uncharacterized protein n=1 Tax=Nocardia pulmonis TaxID=2951408 RepID=A0A9X2E3N5_9NOCA|nr:MULTISPECIES: hypothetical protein [Nocardia]MCM6772488.1 hypothetical protein [Nocardia pulmonis]MCM6784854.1 hypothetical protein [Nocardia sp. CDC159]
MSIFSHRDADTDRPTRPDDASTVGDADQRDAEPRTGPAAQSHRAEEDAERQGHAGDSPIAAVDPRTTERDLHASGGPATAPSGYSRGAVPDEPDAAAVTGTQGGHGRDAITQGGHGRDAVTDDQAAVAGSVVPDEDARTVDSAAKPPQPHSDSPEHDAPLFAEADLERLRIEWREVQSLFVDDPQQAVTRADQLVSTTIDQLTAAVADRKRALETRWRAGQSADTEDLRQALRGYRGFFHRILGAN